MRQYDNKTIIQAIEHANLGHNVTSFCPDRIIGFQDFYESIKYYNIKCEIDEKNLEFRFATGGKITFEEQ